MITSDFSSGSDYRTSPKKTRSCITLCIYRFCFAGTLASGYHVGSSKVSELFSKLAQFKYFEHVVESTFGLQGKHSILFTRLLLLLSLLSSSFDTRKCTGKSNLSSAHLLTSIYWLTTLGFQFTPFKTCRVTVKGNSVVLLTYSSFDGKHFPWVIHLGKNRSHFYFKVSLGKTVNKSSLPRAKVCGVTTAIVLYSWAGHLTLTVPLSNQEYK